MRRFTLYDGDDYGSDEESEEGEGCETPVSEGDESGAMEEEGEEGGDDAEACGGDAYGVEDEGCVECNV